MADTVYSLSITHAKPDCLIKLLHMLPVGQKIYEKHGAKQLGVWTTETGVMNKIVRLVEWPSLTKRMECLTHRFTDPEAVAYFEKCRNYYTQLETFICREDTHIPIGKFSTTRPVMIIRFALRKSEPMTTLKIREMVAAKGNALKDEFAITAFLHPVFYSDRCLFGVWQFKDGYNLDRGAKSYGAFVHSPENLNQMEECGDAYVSTRLVLSYPVQFDKLPQLT